MNVLDKAKQIEIIGPLCEGVGQRAVARLTDTDRKTVARLAINIGRGCAELHDRMMVGLRVHRIECDELWAYVGHKRNPQKGPARPSPVKGDQYTYVALAHQSSRVKHALFAHPAPPCAGHVRPLLLRRPQAFF
jgi:hypothetical protein